VADRRGGLEVAQGHGQPPIGEEALDVVDGLGVGLDLHEAPERAAADAHLGETVDLGRCRNDRKLEHHRGAVNLESWGLDWAADHESPNVRGSLASRIVPRQPSEGTRLDLRGRAAVARSTEGACGTTRGPRGWLTTRPPRSA